MSHRLKKKDHRKRVYMLTIINLDTSENIMMNYFPHENLITKYQYNKQCEKTGITVCSGDYLSA